MIRTLEGFSLAEGRGQRAPLASGLGWGLVGGIAGTLVMDILLMAILTAIGLPALLCFTIVGDTLASFFGLLGIHLAGGIPTGVIAHYLIGPLVGLIFGTAVVRIRALRVDTLKKCLILSILYVEILSQPILAPTPILLKMTLSQTLQWFGGSFVMHIILAVVLGAIMGYGLGLMSRTPGRLR
jgi:hypothetical protein